MRGPVEREDILPPGSTADADARTRRQDLRTGVPLWVKTPRSTVGARRRLDRGRVDVVVVGAGISGALVAEALTAAGHSVLILDRRPAARGSTAASTAMIQHEIDVPLTHLARKIGKAPAEAAWRRSATAVEELVALAGRLGIDCGMARKRTLYLAGDVMGARALKTEAAAREAAGLGAACLTRAGLGARYGIDRTAAILSDVSASANPAQLTAGLLRVAIGRGARLCSPVDVTDMAEAPGSVALATREGEVVVAGHAVFCTGYEHLPQMRSAAHRVTSTWALASRPMKGLPEWLDDTIVWEASDPYLYFRRDPAGRVIAGGEDEEAAHSNADPEKLARKARRIAAGLEALTGIAIGKPAYAWSAPFGVTTDGLPIIDRVKGCERVFAVMGFGGNGITFSMIAARIVATAIAGGEDPDARLFRMR